VLVRKYGGSSLASIERLRAVARDICNQRKDGKQVVVVVSAMGQTTDELDRLAKEANPQPPRREMDMLLSVGERITMSLLSMALAAEGCSAISYTGSQCGIITDNSHTNARITEVKADRVRDSLAAGHVVVVAGFQGMSLPEKEITTLGRGGSDATAVALAAALGAARCEILKDVDGVMTADPKRIPTARRYEALSYDQLRDLAASGCGVVHIQAVEYAASHGVPLYVGSSFQEGPGTQVTPGEPLPETGNHSTHYRPLALIVHEDVAWWEVTISDPATARRWREVLSQHISAESFLTEWIEQGEEFRWGAIAPLPQLAALRIACRDLTAHSGNRSFWRDDCACLTLAGGRPASWPAAVEKLAAVLADQGVADLCYRVDGAALRVLVPARSLATLQVAVHAALLPG
jgi:aspartate kinase